MKFTINRGDLLGVLSNIQGITNRKTSLALTSNVLINADQDGIHLTATDLETGFEGHYPANVESEGTIVLNSKKLFEIIRDFPEQDIFFNEVKTCWVEIGNDQVLYHIVGQNPEEFPQNPVFDETEFINIDSGKLKKMIDKTACVIGAPDDKRAHVCGVYIEKIEEPDRNLIRMVSTDVGRLAKMEYAFGKTVDLPMKSDILVPKKGMLEVSRFLLSEGVVQIGVAKNHFIIKKENETFIIRLLEGDFPSYEPVIVKDSKYDIILEKQPFLMMLKRMSIMVSDHYRAVMFNLKEDKLNISSANPDLGESKEDMAIDYKHPPITIGFNPRYFIESLNIIEDEKVVINICDDNKPCLIEGDKEKNYLSAIMAMNL